MDHSRSRPCFHLNRTLFVSCILVSAANDGDEDVQRHSAQNSNSKPENCCIKDKGTDMDIKGRIWNQQLAQNCMLNII